jgi:hypothetical protein
MTDEAWDEANEVSGVVYEVWDVTNEVWDMTNEVWDMTNEVSCRSTVASYVSTEVSGEATEVIGDNEALLPLRVMPSSSRTGRLSTRRTSSLGAQEVLGATASLLADDQRPPSSPALEAVAPCVC